MKINKQEVQAVADLKAGYTLGHADVAILNELARIALASLEAEPVAWRCGSTVTVNKPVADDWKRRGFDFHSLYTSPPAPVPMKDHQIRELVNELRDIAVEYHGTQQLRERIARSVRAAMLHGKAEPVSQRYKLPDGLVAVPVEPTESMIIDGFESEPDEFFSKTEEWEAYNNMSGCEQAAHRAKLCWAAMIAAAPKQENI